MAFGIGNKFGNAWSGVILTYLWLNASFGVVIGWLDADVIGRWGYGSVRIVVGVGDGEMGIWKWDFEKGYDSWESQENLPGKWENNFVWV